MQRLLRTADWDVEGVRDDVRDYPLAHLGDPVTGILIRGEPRTIDGGTGLATLLELALAALRPAQ
jgi:hypothetical protein